jgi:hypothetical protein
LIELAVLSALCEEKPLTWKRNNARGGDFVELPALDRGDACVGLGLSESLFLSCFVPPTLTRTADYENDDERDGKCREDPQFTAGLHDGYYPLAQTIAAKTVARS